MIASPEIEHGLFYRGVVLVCEHGPQGSFGLLINKQLDMELPQELLSSESINNPHVSLRAGGPVQTSQMMLLHSLETTGQQTMRICDDVYLGGDLQFLQETVADVAGPQINLCFGYSGWGAGQLEREFLDGHWYVAPAEAEAVFTTEPDRLWGQLLREMGGHYVALSMIPDDLTMN